MKRLLLALLTSSMLIPAGQAAARTLDLAFLPPEIEPQDICSAPDRTKEDDLDVEGGDDYLTDRTRISFLRRDIQRLQSEDPEKWFEFIDVLISRRAEIDPDFAGSEALLARMQLFVDANRLDELKSVGLVNLARQRKDLLTNNQRLELAQYFFNGTGVNRDEEFARTLVLEAAFGGNTNALLSLARLELQGKPVQGWEAPLDLTVTMAFGGMLGELNRSVCFRAERIARAYLTGDIVSQNEEIAKAWYKFSADMGGGSAAWRVVEFHLGANAAQKDNQEMRRYLELAIQRGASVSEEQKQALKASGIDDIEDVIKILGPNYSSDRGRNRPSLSHLLEMAINIDGEKADDRSRYEEYLRELSQLPNAPGWVFTELAKEVLIVRGRWAAEPEALELLERAVELEDPEGTQLLGRKLVRYRDDPAILNRAIDLLTKTVSQFGMESSMHYLDGLYRCQTPSAPMMKEAEYWATSFNATQYESVNVSATDLIALDQFRYPVQIAQIQTQALQSRVESLSKQVQRIQVDPRATHRAHRLWAERLDRSDKGLEEFAKLEFELATNPGERRLAVELFRRVYLNNGVTTALDLSIALVEANGKDLAIADEIIELLQKASNRGEGGSIRLMSRLLHDRRTAQSIYEEYADIIEERGDFLALMFSLPYVTREKADDYFDRAVSLMNCGTKDVAELGEAHTFRDNPQMAYHWRRVGLMMEGGHVLSKLRLSDHQMNAFRDGAVPTELQVAQRALSDGDRSANRRLFRLTSDPDLETYDPQRSAEYLLAVVRGADQDDLGWIMNSYRLASDDVRGAINGDFNIIDFFAKSAQSGDVTAKLELGMLMRENAQSADDLARSAQWLLEAAEAGNLQGMAEYGFALAYGLGVPRDPALAVEWLERAGNAGVEEAALNARLVRLSAGQ